jgi:PEP-CTERM motif-containing protein
VVMLVLSVMASRADASTLLMWEFSGTITPVGQWTNLRDLYPEGVPVSVQVLFDTSSPNLRNITQGLGLYPAIRGVTAQVADTSFSKIGGFVTSNCWFEPGCDRLVKGAVEFTMVGPWSGRLPYPEVRPTFGFLQISYIDLGLDGSIPTTPPSTPVGFTFKIAHDLPVLGQGSGTARAIEDIPQVPEPGTVVLFATGLAGLYARKRQAQ